MNIPKLPVETKPFLWGAVAGAAAIAFVGFNLGGWVTGGTAEKAAEGRVTAATVAMLAPICVAQFKSSAKAAANLVDLKKADAWQRGEFVSKGGWATMPGSTAEPNSAVATACAEALTAA